MARYDDVDNKQLFAYIAIFVLGTIITICFVAFLFHYMEDNELRRTMQDTEYTQYNQVLEEQSARLSDYVVVDPKEGRFGIPIEKAIEAAINKAKESGNDASNDNKS